MTNSRACSTLEEISGRSHIVAAMEDDSALIPTSDSESDAGGAMLELEPVPAVADPAQDAPRGGVSM